MKRAYQILGRNRSRVAVVAMCAGCVTGMVVAHGQEGPGEPKDYRGNYSVEVSYVGDSEISEGSRLLGDLNTVQSRVNYLGTFKRTETYSILAGVDWQRFSFGTPDGSAIPDSLQSAAVRVGNDWRFAEHWNLRTEVDPGLYSDFEDISGEDFNAPFSVRLGYSPNVNTTWVAGFGVNFWSDMPVIGGLGVRWRFAEAWTLNLILPRPRVEFRASEAVTLHLGGELKGGSYRVAEDFGTAMSRPELNGEILDYRDIRVGGGLRWQLAKGIALSGEGGWSIDRRFHFDDPGLQLNGQGAAYVQIGISGSY